MNNIEKKLEQIYNLLTLNVEKEIVVDKIKLNGYQFSYEVPFIKSIIPYGLFEHEVKEMIAPLNSESDNKNRPGTKKESLEYIVVHDTASSAKTADEFAHAKYVSNGGGGTSWHYSVGTNTIYHQIPNDEVAYHAGDSTLVRFTLFDTGVKGNIKFPKIEIKDGYYYLNDEKSLLKAPFISIIQDGDKLVYASDNIPQGKIRNNEYLNTVFPPLTTNDINDEGLRVDLIDGKYYMGPTYYNFTYKKIANRGGNLNSIGIEMMINEESNYIRTIQRCAKLVARLLLENNLDVTRVKPHHYFSGKPCPDSLRSNSSAYVNRRDEANVTNPLNKDRNRLWNYYIQMVELEYNILKISKDVKITLISLDLDLTSDGYINKNIKEEKEIKYQIKIELDGCEKVYNGLTKIII